MLISFRKFAVFVVVAVFVPTLAGCASSPVRPEQVARGDYQSVTQHIDRLVEYEMRKHDVVGLSIALIDDQRVVWAKGFGYADQAKNVPATPETVYRVGSISKLFTATAAMQLAEQGRLDIDKPLQTYLPQFSIKSRFPNAGPITPRTMMTHHSGLPSDFARGMWTEKGNPKSFNTVTSDLKDEFVSFPPNYVFSYSNLAVTLLGSAIEQVSGADFATYLERSVLRPIGMEHSAFSTRPDDALMSKGYRDGVETSEPALRDVPAGGLNSNVLDLGRFLQMVFADGRANGREILKASALAEMLRPQNGDVALDQNFHIGLGWILSGLGDIDFKDAGPIAHHGGATMLYRSQLIALPEHKLGVVVLANSESAGVVINKIATTALALALEAKAGIRQPQRTKPATTMSIPSAEDLQRYPGYYATDFGFAKVTRNGDRLYAEALGKQFELIPRGPGLLGLQYKLLGVFPIEIEQLEMFGLSRARVQGHEVLYAEDRGRRLLVAEKITPPSVSQTWKERVGEYEILNGQGDAFAAMLKKIKLDYRDGFLLLELSTRDGDQILPIVPISETEALYMGLGRGRQETIRVLTIDGEEHAASSGYVLRKKRS